MWIADIALRNPAPVPWPAAIACHRIRRLFLTALAK
jgi:hypothetical protein